MRLLFRQDIAQGGLVVGHDFVQRLLKSHVEFT